VGDISWAGTFNPSIWKYSKGTITLWKEYGIEGVAKKIFIDSFDNIYIIGILGNSYITTKLIYSKYNTFGELKFTEYREDLNSGTEGFANELQIFEWTPLVYK